MLHTASTDKWLLRSESQEETPEKFPSSVDDHLLADLYDTKSGKGSQFRHTAITSTPGSNSSILTGKSSSDDVVRSSSLASCSSTPRRQHNPFDTHLGDILKGYTFSPSVFRTVASSNSPSPSVHDRIPQSDFRWSIDQMAIMNPVHIDDHHVLRQYLHQHQLHRNVDPHTEAKYQVRIIVCLIIVVLMLRIAGITFFFFFELNEFGRENPLIGSKRKGCQISARHC